MTDRSPRAIALDILKAKRDHLLNAKVRGKVPLWARWSQPYLEAMLSLHSVEDRYYLDSGYEICLRCRCNLTNWRGPVASALKKELDELLASCPADKHII